MKIICFTVFAVFTTVLIGSTATIAAAQYSDEYEVYQPSPERVTWELRVGTYTPDVGSAAFDTVFGGDRGPLIGTELDAVFYRIPYFGSVGVGVGVSWASYKGAACSFNGSTPDCSSTTSESTQLDILPISMLAVLRMDVLARELSVPLVFTGKLGADIIFYRAKTGSVSDGKGRSVGLHWAAQLALELDFIEPRAARTLDEDWGINHTFLFFELFGSQAGGGLPLGSNLAWTTGLGFNF